MQESVFGFENVNTYLWWRDGGLMINFWYSATHPSQILQERKEYLNQVHTATKVLVIRRLAIDFSSCIELHPGCNTSTEWFWPTETPLNLEDKRQKLTEWLQPHSGEDLSIGTAISHWKDSWLNPSPKSSVCPTLEQMHGNMDWHPVQWLRPN
jgi:hypothetical protein